MAKVTSATPQDVMDLLEEGYKVSVYFHNEDDEPYCLTVVKDDLFYMLGWENTDTGLYEEERLGKRKTFKQIRDVFADDTQRQVYAQK